MQMSWKCDMCDSYNAESSQQCYVCGQMRFAELIKEEKIKLQRRKIVKVYPEMLNTILDGLRMMYAWGLASSFVSVGVVLNLKSLGANSDAIWKSANYIMERMLQNINAAGYVIECLSETVIKHINLL